MCFKNLPLLVLMVLGASGPVYAEETRPPKQTASVVAPGTGPVLLYDGNTQKPALTFTEGPAWLGGKLYFSNYYMFWKPFKSVEEGGPMVIEQDGSVRILNRDMQTCGLSPLGNGNLAACDILDSRIIEITPEGELVRVLAERFEGMGLDGPNDLVVDRRGGIYFTDPQSSRKKKKELPGTAVFYLNPSGKLHRVTEWNVLGFPNGCVLSPDGRTLYLNDSQSFDVLAFDVLENGLLSRKRKFAELHRPKNDPKAKRSNADGMTVDVEGNIYVATPAGIQCIDRNGTIREIIEMPVSPSNCIFGGEDMKTLFVTCRDKIYSLRTVTPGVAYPPE